MTEAFSRDRTNFIGLSVKKQVRISVFMPPRWTRGYRPRLSRSLLGRYSILCALQWWGCSTRGNHFWICSGAAGVGGPPGIPNDLVGVVMVIFALFATATGVPGAPGVPGRGGGCGLAGKDCVCKVWHGLGQRWQRYELGKSVT